jgi:hypothetical protein
LSRYITLFHVWSVLAALYLSQLITFHHIRSHFLTVCHDLSRLFTLHHTFSRLLKLPEAKSRLVSFSALPLATSLFVSQCHSQVRVVTFSPLYHECHAWWILFFMQSLSNGWSRFVTCVTQSLVSTPGHNVPLCVTAVTPGQVYSRTVTWSQLVTLGEAWSRFNVRLFLFNLAHACLSFFTFSHWQSRSVTPDPSS